MTVAMDIPWTPRTIRKSTAPEVRPSIETLRVVIMKALAPFPEARVALAQALTEFDRKWRFGEC